jgi:dienelactone hydrolase
MKNKRREFLKLTGLTGLGVAGGMPVFGSGALDQDPLPLTSTTPSRSFIAEGDVSIIGHYGKWAASLTENKLPSLSFRKKEFNNIDTWRETARKKLAERLGIPDIGKLPAVKIKKQYTYDGLHIEELSWQLPYGRATEAILLKPQNASGKLPAILAFHDHGGNKYFGTRKITRTSDDMHPLMKEHQRDYYSNFAWANEIAKRGYVVLVSDTFTFGSRRVMMQDIPEDQRQGLHDNDPENPDHINAYNKWAGQHEHVMAKSLFCAGTTWPGVFFAEDQKALDILCARPDVNTSRIGCAGLSGGGLRTVMMGGLDPRITCAVCVGFMSTWKDFLLNKSFTHTWMTYVPILPNELDFPEILGLRAPQPTLVLNDSDDFLYTLPEMNRADQILGEVFKKAKAEERYKCSYYPGPHKFDAEMQTEAFAWFDRWMKK